jgi:GntR family transcriptional regulator/MocR family aminotransferase
MLAGRRRGVDWSSLLVPALTDNNILDKALPQRWFEYPYPFVGGQPAAEAFPLRAWLGALREALQPPHLWPSLQDARSSDDQLLVQQLCAEILPARGIVARPDEILITAGSQEGLYLVARALMRTGTRVAVENPGYPDACCMFLDAGAELLPLDVDEHGLQMSDALSQAHVVSVTPSHHFPTSVTMTLVRRRALLAMASANDMIIIEDDYDSELRYQGRPTPALKALDEADRVVYLGSFSKFLAPGLRLGFIVGAPDLIARARDERRMITRHPPGMLQRALALLIASGDYRRALRRYRAVLKTKWELTVSAATEYLPWKIHPPTGGTSIWVSARPRFDTRRLAEVAAGAGILLEPGDVYYVEDPRPTNHLRLGFAAIAYDRIVPGMKLLGRLARAGS